MTRLASQLVGAESNSTLCCCGTALWHCYKSTQSMVIGCVGLRLRFQGFTQLEAAAMVGLQRQGRGHIGSE